MNNNPGGVNQRTLKNLSKNSAELEAKYQMRVNKQASLHKLPTLSDRATQRVKGSTEYVARVRHPDEAMPPALDLWKREVYRPGNGEQIQPLRSGSQEAFTKPSKGYST